MQQNMLNSWDDMFSNNDIWRPPSLSDITPTIFSKMLTHLGSEGSIYNFVIDKVSR